MESRRILSISTSGYDDLKVLKHIQNDAFLQLIARTWDRVPFYRQHWERHNITPNQIASIDDLCLLPFTRKQLLVDDIVACPPFGSFQGNFQNIRLQASSGSSGKPVPFLYTRNDWENITALWARRLAAQGVEAADRVQVTLTCGLFIPGFTSLEGAMKLGALAIPTGSGAVTSSQRQLELAHDWGSTVLGATGGYALHLSMVAGEMGFDPKRDFSFRVMYHTGEPLVEETRRQIEETWGVKSYNNYGSVETGAPTWECRHQNGMHISEDAYLFEVVDPETLEPMPDGEEGAVVVTTLFKEAAPVIRYMTGDIASIWSEPCSCGSIFRRLSPIRGRIDDMLKIQGAAVYPTAIEGVLRQFDELGPEFHIVVDSKNGRDQLEVTVECAPSLNAIPIGLSDRIVRKIKESVGCTAKVVVVMCGSIIAIGDIEKRVKNRYVTDLRKR